MRQIFTIASGVVLGGLVLLWLISGSPIPFGFWIIGIAVFTFMFACWIFDRLQPKKPPEHHGLYIRRTDAWGGKEEKPEAKTVKPSTSFSARRPT